MKKTFFTSYRSALTDQSGQAAVIVFLIMAVMLVVGLSLATRTSQEIELAGQQEDTTRVFNAAESGIEEALSNEANFGSATVPLTPLTGVQNTTTTVSVTPQTGLELTVPSGQSLTVFTGTGTGHVIVNWGKNDEPDCQAVLVVTRYYSEGGNYFAEHEGIRPVASGNGATSCDTPTFQNTRFDDKEVPVGKDSGYKYAARFEYNNSGQTTHMIRIKPLLAQTNIKVTGSSPFISAQSHLIRSQAQDTSGGNTEVRAIEVTRTKPAPPMILDYALYSGGTLSK